MKAIKFFTAALICAGIAYAPVTACDGAKKTANKEACCSKKTAAKDECSSAKKASDDKKGGCCSKSTAVKVTENKSEEPAKTVAPNN